MKLIIAEKNSVAATIAKVVGANNREQGYFRGGDYYVSWCVGHLISMVQADEYDAAYKKWDLAQLPIIPNQIKYSVNPNVSAQFAVIEKLCKQADVTQLISATDAGREGELIFRLVYNQIGVDKPVSRLWVSSLEESSIKAGLSNMLPQSAYDNLYKAAVCRQTCDWLLGINLTRFYSTVYNTLLKVGRVQTPVVNLIVLRQREIENFIPQDYFILKADFGGYIGILRAESESESYDITQMCTGRKATVTKVTNDKKKENPPALYDITNLQRDANRTYKYSAKQTLELVQKLYEDKLLTYPRTDSRFITEDMHDTMLQNVKNILELSKLKTLNLDVNTFNIRNVINNKKVSDHHAIITTKIFNESEFNKRSEEEKNILSLVFSRMVEAVMPAYEYAATKIWTDVSGNIFQTTGNEVIELGFKKIRTLAKNSEREQDEVLPAVQENDVFTVQNVNAEKKQTRPSPFYTEDTLLRAMETAGKDIENEEFKDAMKNKGLGTAATRAEIIESVIKTGYVERENNRLYATKLAQKFIDLVLDKIKEPELTGQWEKQLADIEHADAQDTEFISSVSEFLTQFIADFKSTYNPSNYASLATRQAIGVCPKCNKSVIEYSKAFSCESGKGGCGFVIWKTIAGKSISLAMVQKLLKDKSTAVLKGFKSKAGKDFNAKLVLKEDKTVGFEFDNTRKSK